MTLNDVRRNAFLKKQVVIFDDGCNLVTLHEGVLCFFCGLVVVVGWLVFVLFGFFFLYGSCYCTE